VFEWRGGWIGSRRKLVEAAVGVSVDDLRGGLGEIGVGINLVELPPTIA
jgi:hypothetical protein